MSDESPRSALGLSPDNPWPGLESFDEASNAFFFGMHAETAALFRLVRRETLTLFYGRSGLGKTSLLQAGLFPRLREANLLPVPIRQDYGPKSRPLLSQVKEAVARALSRAGIDTPSPGEGESLWEYFHRSDIDFWDSQNRLVTLVLVFDQFEERFTLGRQSADIDVQAEACLTELCQLVENRPPPLLKSAFETQVDAAGSFDFDKRTCKVILSLREDFLPELETLRDRFPSILENSMRLQAMSEAQAMDVVLGPGSRPVNKPVAREIVRFVGGADQQSKACFTVEPVLLSVVLYGLNQRRRQNQLATITSDLLLGTRDQILDSFYEDALKGLPEKACRLVEDGLLTSSGRRDTLAWEDALAEFGVDEQDVLTLIDRHLLRREDRSDGARVELVHDRLADVVRKHRDSRRQQEREARELADLKLRQEELEREKERQRLKAKRLLMACVALAVFAGALSAYIVWIRNQNSPHEAYFSTYRQRNGIFEGVGPLTKKQVSRRSSSFKFIRQGPDERLVRVQAVDNKGRPTHRHSVGTYIKFKSAVNVFSGLGIDENPARECQWEFVQDEAREIAYELAYDKNGTRVWGLAYSPSLGQGLQKVAHFVEADGLPNKHTASAAEYIRLEYWPDGLEKQLTYLDHTGRPTIGPDGAYAEHYDYDTLGLTKRVVWIDASGHPMTDNDGVAILEINRDAMGNDIQETVLDPAGKPAVHKKGWSRAVMTYDEYGNQTGLAFHDPSGRPCLDKQSGVAKVTSKYDERGNRIELALFDANDRPCLHRQFGVAKVTSKYDERGNQIEATCFGTNDKPCLNKYGIARESHKFDERGNMTEAADFDMDGKPCLNTVGVSKAIFKFDERSNLIATEWYGIDGHRCLTKDGFAKETTNYDERGNQIEWACFGLGNEPAINKANRSHRVKTSYDEPGNCIAWEFYGVDGKRCIMKDGYAKATADYDERGNQVEWACFGLHDRPAISKADGTHSVKKSYDSRGNCITWEYYGVDGRRCLTKDGYAKETAIYDERGNRIEKAYFDEASKPVRGADGYARVATSYDARGNVIGAAYFDERGKPVQNNDGFVRFTASYDERDNRSEEAYFDEAGKPAQRKEGYARFTASYDERGNQIAGTYLNELGKPVRSTDGYARFTAIYDTSGNIISAAYFDERNKPVQGSDGFVRFTANYDEYGNKIEVATFDEGGKLAQRKEGYARFTARYDERGNQIEEAYFDEADKPVRNTDGYARFTASYDERGNQTEWACFGSNDEPAIDKSDGTHRVKKAYDESGNCTNWDYYGVDGKRCLTKEGYARITANYDEFGNRLEQVQFDLTGNSTVKKYDQRRQQIEEAYFNEGDKPITNKNGIARWIAKNSEGANQADITYFDPDGKPIAVQIYVSEVLPDGQARERGLAEGDVLVSYDGKPMRRLADLPAYTSTPGDTMRELIVSRSGRSIGFKVKPGKIGIATDVRAAPAAQKIHGTVK